MNTNIGQQTGQAPVQSTAIIIQFPTGGRAGLAAHRADAAAIDRSMQHNPDVMYGSSWYHAEAIAEAKQKPV